MSKFINFLSKIFGSKKEETKIGGKTFEHVTCEKCEPKFNLKKVEEPKTEVITETPNTEVKVEKPILIKKPIQKKSVGLPKFENPPKPPKKEIKAEQPTTGQSKPKPKKKYNNKKNPPKV